MKKLSAAVVVAIAGISVAVAAAASSPAVVTRSVSSVSGTAAVLHGTVNPNGSSSTYYFIWGLTTGYGATGKPLSAGAGIKPVAVHGTASGLIPGTVYHYRLVATNRFGVTFGNDRTFRTAGHPPPGVATGPATGLSSSGATLTGAVNPAGAPTTWWFQWGGSPSFGEETAHQLLPAGAAPQSVAASLQGLLNDGILYYYRLVASHGAVVTSYGATGSFLTYPSPRPQVHVSAGTRPRHARHKPYVLTTTGSLTAPSWMPSTYACTGNVTIRFFSGRREVAFGLAGVQPNCTFGAQTVFARLPGRKPHPPVHLRIVVRYISTPYLATNRAPIEHVTLG
jgi:hypothetical protein